MCNFGFIESDKIINQWVEKLRWWILIAWILLIILLACKICHADTYTYLIYLENFPQDRYRISVSTTNPIYRKFTAIGKQSIKEASGQPFCITAYKKNSSGVYAILNITPTATELKQLQSIEVQGYAKLLSINDVVNIYHPEKGGYITEFIETKKAELPKDFESEIITSTITK